MLSPNTSTHIFIMFPVFFPVGGFFHWRSSPPVPTPAETGWSGGTLSVQLQILPCWNRWGQMPIYWGCQGLHWDHRRSVYFSKSKCVLGGAAAKMRTGSKTSRLKSLSQYLCWICTELHPRNVATAASLRVAEKGGPVCHFSFSAPAGLTSNTSTVSPNVFLSWSSCSLSTFTFLVTDGSCTAKATHADANGRELDSSWRAICEFAWVARPHSSSSICLLNMLLQLHIKRLSHDCEVTCRNCISIFEVWVVVSRFCLI